MIFLFLIPTEEVRGTLYSTKKNIYFVSLGNSSFHLSLPLHRTSLIPSIPTCHLSSEQGLLSFSVTLYIHLTILISYCWNLLMLSSLTAI
ncbi:hypothetical protein Hamer_G010195 [Homarus americanus]|uniref:Uncharacterized protein n=1 Tax=Homarus americanus TaxID=6706 RepID=A0A8J5MY19_HOMAM|nr:hypothetical protein Hamer_G010195 [Homarus americanus]